MEKYLINPKDSIRNTLKKMDESITKTLYIHEQKKLLGAVSDGDVRRAILAGLSLEEKVDQIMNQHPICYTVETSKETIKKTFLEKQIESIPIVNEQGEIINILFWKNIFEEKSNEYVKLYNEVVIMAGGKGTRMKPFTHIFPKPLVPIGEKTMIEIIMDEFKKYNIHNFYLTVNYKKELLKAYFSDDSNYGLTFIDEPEFLGTAGSLKLIGKKFKNPFFVVNCDILIKCDYSEIVEFHTKNNYALTMVASMQHIQIPYGVCEIETGGELLKIDEKPNLDFLVNTGLYLLNPEVTEYIPKNKFFHITHLMETLKKNGLKVGVFPISEKSWIDIGQWEQYKSSLNYFN